MTNTELKYFNALRSILAGTPYVLLPQIALSSIVTRKNKHKFQNELNRVVDFCVFSPEFAPLICIEINDSTHLLKHRIERDKKVQNILKNAKLPLVTIWTNEKFDYKQIASLEENERNKVVDGLVEEFNQKKDETGFFISSLFLP